MRQSLRLYSNCKDGFSFDLSITLLKHFFHILNTIGMFSSLPSLYARTFSFHRRCCDLLLQRTRYSEKSGRRVYPCLCVRHGTKVPKKLVQFWLTSLLLERRYLHGLLRTNLPTFPFALDYFGAILRCLKPRSFAKDLNSLLCVGPDYLGVPNSENTATLTVFITGNFEKSISN